MRASVMTAVDRFQVEEVGLDLASMISRRITLDADGETLALSSADAIRTVVA